MEEIKAKLMAQVMAGEIDADDMFNILEAFEKSKEPPPQRTCDGSGGHAWHDASYGMQGNGGILGIYEFVALTVGVEQRNGRGGFVLYWSGPAHRFR